MDIVFKWTLKILKCLIFILVSVCFIKSNNVSVLLVLVNDTNSDLTPSVESQTSLLALNGGGRFLSPSSPLSSLLCSLVS